MLLLGLLVRSLFSHATPRQHAGHCVLRWVDLLANRRAGVIAHPILSKLDLQTSSERDFVGGDLAAGDVEKEAFFVARRCGPGNRVRSEHWLRAEGGHHHGAAGGVKAVAQHVSVCCQLRVVASAAEVAVIEQNDLADACRRTSVSQPFSYMFGPEPVLAKHSDFSV